MGDTETKTKINPWLAGQSYFAGNEARRLYETMGDAPEQYVGISGQRQGAMDQMMALTQRRGGSGVPQAAVGEWNRIMGGEYLDGGANPYLNDIVNRSANQAGAAQMGGFAGGGRFGSGAMANAMASAMQGTASNLYGANYQNERQNMMAAMGHAPMMEQMQYADMMRQQQVGQQYEDDQANRNKQDMVNWMQPYMRLQQFEQSLGNNQLGKESTVTKSFDWGGAAMGLLNPASDRALKKNVTRVGTSDSGIPEYTFEYIAEEIPGVYHGVMAQDIIEDYPHAVVDNGEYLAVNYTMIDADFYRVL